MPGPADTGGRSFPDDHWLPALDRLLLRVALGAEPQARAEWQGWRPGRDLTALPAASVRLLPLIALRLPGWGMDEPALRQLRTQSLLRNREVLDACAAVLRILAAAAIPAMVLKGAAVIGRYWPDAASRPMGDSDVAVPFGRAAMALDVLARHGWMPSEGASLAFVRDNLVHRQHGTALRRGDGPEVDLHWHVMHEAAGAGEAAVWRAARPVTVAGATALAMAPTDQLLHILLHGARWSPAAGGVWAADALFLLQREGAAMDWERLLRRAEEWRALPALKAALALLAGELAAPVPATVLDRLARQRAFLPDRLRHAALSRPRAQRTALQRLALRLHAGMVPRPAGSRRMPPPGLPWLSRAWGWRPLPVVAAEGGPEARLQAGVAAGALLAARLGIEAPASWRLLRVDLLAAGRWVCRWRLRRGRLVACRLPPELAGDGALELRFQLLPPAGEDAAAARIRVESLWTKAAS